MMDRPIQSVACIGTGTMGFGVALVCAQAGYKVKMYGRSDESIRKALNNLELALERFMETGIINQQQAEEIVSRIHTTKDLAEACADADFLIESVAEDLTVKQSLFKQCSELCPDHTILATNTSGLSPTEIAKPLDCPDRMLVAHFWNPPHLVPLVEIVPNKDTSQKSMDIAYQFILSLKKKPVMLKKEIAGFLGNRIQFAILREALYLMEMGIASQEDIDDAVKYSLGRRLGVTGPLESADLGGLDVFLNISSYLLADLCSSPDPSPVLREKVENNQYGSKVGIGFYDWNTEWGKNIKSEREKALIEWIKKDEPQ